MESRAITNAQITASSEHSHKHAASHARLNFQEIPSMAAGAWVAHGRDDNPWLQVDLGAQYTKVTRVATQGRNSSQYSQWVTKYKLQYGDKNEEFQYYREPGQDTDEVKNDRLIYFVLILRRTQGFDILMLMLMSWPSSLAHKLLLCLCLCLCLRR